METELKVGGLAARTGLTVRTLHHYDEIGLLSPARRTPSGHRLYGETEVLRLQRISSLRHLGLPLEEIRECLARPGYSLERVLELQLDRIRERIRRQESLRDVIQRLLGRLHSAEGASVDDLTRTIEATMNYEKHYSPDQLTYLRDRARDLGAERIQAVQQEWEVLFSDYQAAMDAGLDPTSEEVKALARRSAALVAEFTGGDPGIQASLREMYREQGGDQVMTQHGMAMAPGLWEFMGRAGEALSVDAKE